MTTDPITVQAGGAVRTVFRLDLDHVSTWTLELTPTDSERISRYTVVVTDSDEVVVIPPNGRAPRSVNPFDADRSSEYAIDALLMHIADVG